MTADRRPPKPETDLELEAGGVDPHALVEADDTTWALREVLRGYVATNVALGRSMHLSPTDLSAMEHLLDGGEDLGPVELGHRLGIRSASATALVDRLEHAGHLQRKPHPTDRRRRMLAVTETATTQLLNTIGPVISDLTAVSAALNDEERATVQRYLTDVSAVLWKRANSTIAEHSDGAAPD